MGVVTLCWWPVSPALVQFHTLGEGVSAGKFLQLSLCSE